MKWEQMEQSTQIEQKIFREISESKLLTEGTSGSCNDSDCCQPRGAPRPERRRGGLSLRPGAAPGAIRGGVVPERVDGDGDLHALQAEAVAADEVVAAGLGERDEVLAGGPVAGDPVHGAVVVPRLVHLEHVVRPLLVPERCTATSRHQH